MNRKAVVVISLLTAACLLGDSMLYIVLPIHFQSAGLTSLWEVGILLSVNRLVRLPLNPLVGWLYGRMSSRSGVLFAGVLAVGTTLSYAFCQGFAAWLLLRCLWGVAWTFLRLGAYFTILNVSGETNRGYYMGLYNGLYRLGSLGGMLAGGYLADRFGLSATAMFFSALTLISLPFAFRLIPAAASHGQTESAASGAGVGWREAGVFWPLFTGLVIAMAYQGVFVSTLSHLIEAHYAPVVSIAGLALGAASLAGVLQALRWGWEPWLAPWIGHLSDGQGGRQRLLIGALTAAAAFLSLLAAPLPVGVWLLLVIGVLLTATALTTLADAVACDAAVGRPQKAFMTAYSFSIDIGAALGPMTAFSMNSVWGPYAVYWLLAVLLLLLALKWRFRSPLTA